MYEIKPTTKFKKDVKRLKRRGYDMELLNDVIKKLAMGEQLPPENKVHSLNGEYEGYQECHITSDWVLIYEKYEGKLILFLTRTGTHSDVFKE